MSDLEKKNITEKEKRAALWGGGTLAVVGLAFFIFAIYIIFIVQGGINDISDVVLLPVSALMFIAGLSGFILVWRNKVILGAAILFTVILIPPIPATLTLIRFGYVALIYVIVLAPMMIAWVLPISLRRTAIVSAVVVAIGVIAVEIWNPGFRTDSTLVPDFATTVIVLAGLLLAGFFARQMWVSGHLRNRIIVMVIVILSPVLIISTYINVRAQQQDLEQVILDRAKSSAITGAETIGHLLEEAIANGQLTQAEVFDRNYTKFWEINPASYPDLQDDPTIYNKYHTAYDAFTDEHWQNLLDSYLTQQDILYAVASDINGYVPTHNLISSTGDGNLATDRTKRIFNDPVGIKASQNTEPILQQIYQQSGTGATLWDVSAPIYVNGQHWGAFRIGVALAENQVRVQAATFRAVATSTILVLVVILFAWFLGQYITGPLEQLTKVSQDAAVGNLVEQINIPDRAEITVLANSFNVMVTQIRDLVVSLEQRVESRTKALSASTEVSRRLSTILDQERLMREVVEQLASTLNYYHAHVYLFDEDKENLILVSGTGDVGRKMLASGHKIKKGSGLVGRAAGANQMVFVPDVSRTPGWLPNPLLPDTKAEVAAPIAVGDDVVGVLNVQQNVTDGMDEQDANLIQSIANQIAVALQNARAYEKAQRQAQREARIVAINQRIQAATTMEDVLQIAVSELGQALDAQRSSVNLEVSSRSKDGRKQRSK
jgi:methyl-accepting chemotaxis protein